MKLATLANGTRDGRLVVVSRDLAFATDAGGIAKTLQEALDDWTRLAPRLATLAISLEAGSVPRERFREHEACSPLPRAFQWIDGSAYLSHVELVRKARGAAMPPEFFTDPLLYQGGSDAFWRLARPYACRTKVSASTSRPKPASSSRMLRWARTEPRPPRPSSC